MPQVIRSRADRALQGADGFPLLFGALGIRPWLILKNKKKAACNGFTGADLLYKLQIILLHQPALFIGFLRHFAAHRVHMAGNVRPARQNLKLQLDRTDL